MAPDGTCLVRVAMHRNSTAFCGQPVTLAKFNPGSSAGCGYASLLHTRRHWMLHSVIAHQGSSLSAMQHQHLELAPCSWT